MSPDPADFSTHAAWLKARVKHDSGRLFNMPPPRAQGVLAWLALALVVFAVALVLIDLTGARLGRELRGGVAEVSECSSVLTRYNCRGMIRFDDGTITKDAPIRATERVDGVVRVVAVGAWYSGTSTVNEQMWVTEHRRPSRPLLFPTIWLGAIALNVVLGLLMIGPVSRWAVRRSKQRWARARRAAGRPADDR